MLHERAHLLSYRKTKHIFRVHLINICVVVYTFVYAIANQIECTNTVHKSHESHKIFRQNNNESNEEKIRYASFRLMG